MKLTFLGAAKTVTGSKYLIEHDTQRILIDCGLFQGHKELRLRNWAPFPIDPRSIDSILLTHAHLDHSGYLPLLVKNGFKGPIFCTKATAELCRILLPDSGHIQEEDARRANKYHYSKHKKALPLYTEEEALKPLEYMVPIDFNREVEVAPNLKATFHRAGHILGAASIELRDPVSSVLFSGDIGRLQDPILKAPEQIPETDYLILESTYGDRLHTTEDPLSLLEAVIQSTLKKGGSVLVPAFAVGRAQTVLYYIQQLKKEKRIPADFPIFLNSPMALNATALLCQHLDELRLHASACKAACNAATYVRTAVDSMALMALTIPKLVIAASGMATGGRVLRHLQDMLPDDRNTILFAGFQSGGTRGDRLVRGEKEIKIFGKMIPVRARIENIGSLSAHADYKELLTWVGNRKTAPKKVFLTHGEEESAIELARKIKKQYRWKTKVPIYLDTVDLI